MGESLSLLEKGFKPGETKSEMTDYFFIYFICKHCPMLELVNRTQVILISQSFARLFLALPFHTRML